MRMQTKSLMAIASSAPDAVALTQRRRLVRVCNCAELKHGRERQRIGERLARFGQVHMTQGRAERI
jgi:hypothetical protein